MMQCIKSLSITVYGSYKQRQPCGIFAFPLPTRIHYMSLLPFSTKALGLWVQKRNPATVYFLFLISLQITLCELFQKNNNTFPLSPLQVLWYFLLLGSFGLINLFLFFLSIRKWTCNNLICLFITVICSFIYIKVIHTHNFKDKYLYSQQKGRKGYFLLHFSLFQSPDHHK